MTRLAILTAAVVLALMSLADWALAAEKFPNARVSH